MNTGARLIIGPELCEDVLPPQLLGVLLNVATDSRINKRVWPYKKRKTDRYRSKLFCEVTVKQYQMDQFKECFKMSRTSFESLLNVVAMRRVDFEEPIAKVVLEKKLLFTIWLLTKQESFQAVGDRFDIAKSSGHLIFEYMIFILVGLTSTYIKWPSSAQQMLIADVFELKSRGIPGVIGAIENCHIPITEPVRNARDFCNAKKYHSIIVQGVCDSAGRFIDVFIGQPGGMHSARVYKSSTLYAKISNESDPLIRQNMHLIGVSYPLSINLLTPYQDDGQLTAAQIRYNVRFSMIKTVIARTFVLLKRTFCRLDLLDVKSTTIANHIVMACCVLHNFILIEGDCDEWDYFYEPNIEIETTVDSVPSKYERVTLEAYRKRDSIKEML